MPRKVASNTHGLWVGGTLASLLVHGCSPDFDALNAGVSARGGVSAGGGAVMGGRGGTAGGGTASGGTDGGTTGTRGGAPANAGTGTGGGATASNGGETTSDGGTSATGGAVGMAGDASATGGQGDAGGGAGAGGEPLGGEGGVLGDPSCPDLAGKALAVSIAAYATASRVIQESFTIEVWIRKATSKEGVEWWAGSPMLWADTNVAGAKDFALVVVNRKFVINVGTPDVQVTSRSDVTTGVWIHVAATRNHINGALQVFVDGQLEATAAGPQGSLDAVAELSIGTSAFKDVFFDGEMDELRLWSTVRTPAEIQATLHRVLSGKEPGLAGYYRFDEVLGSKLPDSSSTANDATRVGAGDLVTSSAPLCDSELGSAGAGGAASGAGAAGATGAGGSP